MPRAKVELIREEDGSIRMTKANLKRIVVSDDMYEFPELNNKLYLHFKGFFRIENLEEYVNLTTLWMESNAFRRIENLSHLQSLHTLFLHNNVIFKIEGLGKFIDPITKYRRVEEFKNSEFEP